MNQEEVKLFNTEEELRNACDAYEEQRCIGTYNMMDLMHNTKLTGLTNEQYVYILLHYKELNNRYGFRED